MNTQWPKSIAKYRITSEGVKYHKNILKRTFVEAFKSEVGYGPIRDVLNFLAKHEGSSYTAQQLSAITPYPHSDLDYTLDRLLNLGCIEEV